MSPLLSPPLRGYTDEQRVQNYDTGALWSPGSTVVTTSINSGVQPVDRFAYSVLQLPISGAELQVQFLWYLDPAGTIIVGERRWEMDPNVAPTNACFRILNEGPFVKVTLTTFTPSTTVKPILFATNRIFPLESVPFDPIPIDQQGAAIGAMSTVTIYAADYYAGPIAVWFNPGFATWQILLQYLSAAGSWNDIQVANGTATGQFPFTWVTPISAWRMQVINNTAGASVFFLAATPSTTGSS